MTDQRALRTLILPDADATSRLGRWIAPRLAAGDVLLLHGQIGAGKTHFARALIQERLAVAGTFDDVPSPTFTLVQTYVAGNLEIWHADLYRLNHMEDVMELGLQDAFGTALCLVEWPERLGMLTPKAALHLYFSMTPPDSRMVTISGSGKRWARLLHDLAAHD